MQGLPIPSLQDIRRRFDAIPRPPVEDSIPLRVLVQGLVIVGIIATDIAAETNFSFWAVPLSIVGGFWSASRRRDRNTVAKFLIALGMLGALGLFFANLSKDLVDTRIVLAELLIQLQVLHSFDLPSRKDLGYSMVIGLILLGVAGTVSQTIAFAPFLLLFLAVGLPTLVLDYRSRLGLLATQTLGRSTGKFRVSRNTLRNGSYLFLGVVALGLTIFAFMPRFPAYQFQNFPVSGPSQLQDQDFSDGNRSIVNPGYIRGGRQGRGGNNQGQNGEEVFDENQYYGFNSRMNQNLRGVLKPRIVLRVRSQSPGFWRVLAFDRYTGQGWELSREKQVLVVNRPSWTYRFQLPTPAIRTQTKQVIQTYSVVSELPNLIPALSYPRDLFYPTVRVAMNTEGGLQSPGSLPEGLTYTVISDVPLRDRTLLGKASQAYPSAIKTHYLQIPEAIAAKVRSETQRLLATSPKPLTEPYEQALYLAQALKQRYSLPNNPFGLPPLSKGEDLVEAFLFKHQGGYADHFSTTLTVMLRSISIPARLVAGFAPGQFNPFTGFYVVRNTDAYAMTEVYFPQYGWFAFDPIPGHPLIPPSVEEDQTFSVLKQFWNWVAGWLPSPVRGWFAGLFGVLGAWLFGSLGNIWRFLSSGWVGLMTGIVLAVGVAFLLYLAWQWLKTLRTRLWISALPPMEGIYQEMLWELGRQGYSKHRAQTPYEFNRELHHRLSTENLPWEAIDSITHAYVQWRYGSVSPEIGLLKRQLRQLRQQLGQSKILKIRKLKQATS